MLKQLKIFGFALVLLLAFAGPASAANLTSIYMAAGGSAAVTITNDGPDAVYNVSLQPSGAGVAPQVASVSVGDIAAGAKAFIKVDGVSPAGYIFLNGTGTDSTGQLVSISIVSKGN
ncbi:MAG: hypothetical protein COW19_06585 [Zetaproteobacteria bacterium CG12_big_fil_rev_8_21_14_0_65_55_1124]|nr:MAG: hypothetical protein COT53_05845 [Zetaproteobacteria bacterium CG08_land_8_20_14_0_20_55_17]PIW42742.1 MAG: hypothetical protein COW19_06585 [Zetaproteobacteria bacterium CG12_big_fil_rev_8_21_14_0_65_55_1124]PIY51733.1 MAG: hypothetical protein COZ01_10135 [Zetaproteobacteria bacterium CG_4_10_14_0_8_um_filter_55_43]PIZ36699.1 MAG: hypothetical protein COY36_11445 [Zetaproteobacteria bacterium CG_4_10_14_0_2_um_filter_55_20]PJB81488.1 MAG: hypothetical protein CO089_04315 [Zetaproteoba